MQERLHNLPTIMASQRRTKQNLACFLSDKIFDNSFKTPSTETAESSSISNCKKISPNNVMKNDINTAENNTPTNSNIKKGNRKQKKAVSTNTLGSAMQSILVDVKLASPTSVGVGKEKKEDYWYYDKESDGFYYEFAGSRGWRKRNKNTPIQSLPQTSQTFKSKNPLPMEIPHPHDSENISNYFYNDFSTNNKTTILPSTSSSGSLTNKIYDPHSDGYYYNMGSVEGWKRRTDSVTSSSKNSCSSPIFNNQQSIRSQVQSNESAVSYDNEWVINNVKDGDSKNINEFGSSVQSTGSSAASSILDEGFQPKFFIPNQNSITSKTYASYFDNISTTNKNQHLLQHPPKDDSGKQTVFDMSTNNKNIIIRNLDVEMQQENNEITNKFNHFKIREPQVFVNIDPSTYMNQGYEYNDMFLTNDLNKAFSTSECFNDRSNLIDTTNRDVWGFRTTISEGGSYTCGGEETDYKALEQIWQNLDNNLLTGGEIGCTN